MALAAGVKLGPYEIIGAGGSGGMGEVYRARARKRDRDVAIKMLPESRWVVERTLAWLNQFRRLRVRYDKRADIHEAFLSLGCAMICWQSLSKTWRTG